MPAARAPVAARCYTPGPPAAGRAPVIPQSHQLARTQLLSAPIEVPRGLGSPPRPSLRAIGERLGDLGLAGPWPVGERFAVGPSLGAGASAAVVAAHDRDLDREVALKVIG